MNASEYEGMTPRAKRMRELEDLLDEVFGADFLLKEEQKNERTRRT